MNYYQKHIIRSISINLLKYDNRFKILTIFKIPKKYTNYFLPDFFLDCSIVRWTEGLPGMQLKIERIYILKLNKCYSPFLSDFASRIANSAIIKKELNKMAGEQCQNLQISSYLNDILSHNINTNVNKHQCIDFFSFLSIP